MRVRKKDFENFYTELKNELEAFRNFIYERKAVVMWIIGIAIVTYLYEICNFTMTADEEREITNAIGTNLNITSLAFKEGRYGAGFLKRFFMYEGIFTPAYATILAVIFLVLAALAWCYNFNNMLPHFKHRNISFVLLGGIFLSLPYASIGIMNYSTINTGVMCGVFIVPITMNFLWRFIKGKNIWNLVVSILLSSFVLSIYQSLTSDLVLASCLCCIFWQLNGGENSIKKLMKTVSIYIGNFTVAVLVYFSTSNVIGTSGYTDSFVLWGTRPSGELIKDLISDWGGYSH